jgi:nickel/cobalt transporter (NicO) family protein
MKVLGSVSALLLAGVLLAGVAFAHPMGNLSVNHYARLEPGAKGLEVTYVLDLAELPTFELTQAWNVARDARKDVLEAKAREQAREWVKQLTFTEDGKALTPLIESTDLAIVDGAGNLPVFRITTKLHVPAAGGRVEYADGNYATRAGWREVVIKTGGGAEISRASNGDTDLSDGLTSYPQDPTKAPPQNTTAWLEWKPVAGQVSQVRKPVVVASAPAPAAVTAPAPPPAAEPARDVRPPEAQAMGSVKRNDAISKILRMETISWPLLAALIGLSFWFGALHALEPGHGKTMVAAYLVGAKGTPKHAALLGGMVTFTHTISVFILGLVTMFLSRYIMPDRISRVLGIVSGLSIVWIGAMLLWRRWRKLAHDRAHQTEAHHHHGQSHTHTHLTHTHDDGHTHSHVPEGDISMGSLMALGASGGLVPCPSALILLLSAISIGRVGLGMVLLLAFSLGLAIVLTVTGMFVLYAKNLFPKHKRNDNAFFRVMPVVSAAAILLIGVLMTSVSLGWVPANRFIG